LVFLKVYTFKAATELQPPSRRLLVNYQAQNPPLLRDGIIIEKLIEVSYITHD